jgi:hypothetical protein
MARTADPVYTPILGTTITTFPNSGLITIALIRIVNFHGIITSDQAFSFSGGKGDMIAGMAAILMPIMADLNDNDQGISYKLHCTADLHGYKIKKHILEKDIVTTPLLLRATDMIMWIRNPEMFFYDVYCFNSADFFQGIFTVTNHLQADYRNYLYGLPLDGQGQPFELLEYGLTAPNLVASAALDLDDIEAQEEDDENIIAPYERTDDIVTVFATNNSFEIEADNEPSRLFFI